MDLILPKMFYLPGGFRVSRHYHISGIKAESATVCLVGWIWFRQSPTAIPNLEYNTIPAVRHRASRGSITATKLVRGSLENARCISFVIL